ncbi:MAG: lipopolysaccharide biosynthesis protein [Plesiomonas shigelloides]
MSLIKSATTIGGASVISQVIGAVSVWLISHKFGMNEVGTYALTYSVALIGAQVAMFASQLLLPKVTDEEVPASVMFCLLQAWLIPLPYTLLMLPFFSLNPWTTYLLTVTHALILVAENLALRSEHFQRLGLQRISASLTVLVCLALAPSAGIFYWAWALLLFVVIGAWLLNAFDMRRLQRRDASLTAIVAYWRTHRVHLSGIGSAEVLAMATANLPVMLVNYWFSPLVAGYFAVVTRFCLAPVQIIGNAVRNSVFSRWSVDFRHQHFNAVEFAKVRWLLLGMGAAAVVGIWIFYPLIMHAFFDSQWVDSIQTSRYMLPYVFTALAICPLTVIELVYGSAGYFLRIQIEQLLVVVLSLLVLPYFYPNYSLAVLAYASLTALRYAFIYLRVNHRARLLTQHGVRG